MTSKNKNISDLHFLDLIFDKEKPSPSLHFQNNLALSESDIANELLLRKLLRNTIKEVSDSEVRDSVSLQKDIAWSKISSQISLEKKGDSIVKPIINTNSTFQEFLTFLFPSQKYAGAALAMIILFSVVSLSDNGQIPYFDQDNGPLAKNTPVEESSESINSNRSSRDSLSLRQEFAQLSLVDLVENDLVSNSELAQKAFPNSVLQVKNTSVFEGSSDYLFDSPKHREMGLAQLHYTSNR